MARGGFLGRFVRGIEKFADNLVNIFTPSPRPPEPPREPPPEPPPSQYRKTWRQMGGKGDYRKNLDVFHRLVDPVEDDPAERQELWKSYIRNINRGEGQYRRQDNQNLFWRDSGIDPRSFNWQRWREAMGYTGKRRSRTP